MSRDSSHETPEDGHTPATNTVQIRLSKTSVDLEWGELQDLIGRTLKHPRGAGTAEALSERQALGGSVVFTNAEKGVISAVMEQWFGEVGVEPHRDGGPRRAREPRHALPDVSRARTLEAKREVSPLL